jgi:hypothetical protein
MTPATAMGHMHQKRRNIRSTTNNEIKYDLEDETVTPVSLRKNIIWFTPWLLTKGSST